MEAPVAKYFSAFTMILMLNIIFPVGGQCTVLVQGCAVDNSSNNTVAQMQEVKIQLNIVITSLLAVKNQQDSVMTSLQAVERRLQEQNVYIKQVQSVHELINASLQLIVQRLDGQDISTKNQTQTSWTQEPASGIGDWIVIMYRFDASVNFRRNWNEYRNGFGDKERGEFWLGNEEVYRLTNRIPGTLRVQVQLNSSGEWYYAEYSSFSLDSESKKYKLHLSGYSGNAGDALTNSTFLSTRFYHGGMNFSTWDNDNDQSSSSNCAKGYLGGWWFNNCKNACLTCPYGIGFYWTFSGGSQASGILRASRMMIRSA